MYDDAHARFMALAIDLARRAADMGESPVAAVIVLDGRVIGSGHNRMETESDPTAHAEILALREAGNCAGDWRLRGGAIYVTVEPCIMCAAAVLHSRISRVVFGAYDPRWGGFGSLFDFSSDPRINHRVEVVSGVMEKEARELMQGFFQRRRDAREAEGG